MQDFFKKQLARCIPLCAIVAGILMLGAAPTFATAPIAATEGCTVPGKGSLLRVRMEFSFGDLYGQVPTSAQKENFKNDVEEFEKRTERAFNESGYKNADGSRIILDIDAQSLYDPVGNAGPNTHLVFLYGNANHRDRVDRLGEINSDSRTMGDWKRATIKDPFETGQALHEMGHQMGLADAYEEYVTDRAGRRNVPAPGGMRTDLNGNIFEPQRWRRWARRHDLDPGSLRIRDTTKPGHNGDIMAGYTIQGRFRSSDLRRLLRGAPGCRDEDNELFDIADDQPDFDTRGPKQGRTCYTHLKPPLKGVHYAAALQGKKSTGPPTGPGYGAPFVAYSLGRYRYGYDRDIQLLRYAHLEPFEVSEIKIACNWRKEVAYIKKVMELFSAIEKLNNDNIYLAQTAPCNYYTKQIDNQTFWKINHRRYMIDMDSYAIHEEILQRLATATGAFQLKRYRGRPVRGYPPSDFPRFNPMANDIYEKVLVLFNRSEEASEQQSVALSERSRQCYNI